MYMDILLALSLALSLSVIAAQKADPEYGGDGMELEKNRVKLGELQALTEGNAISSKVVVPKGAVPCRGFKQFSKKPCPRQFTGKSYCQPITCFTENTIAYTECNLPVKLVVPYKIVGKMCKLTGAGRDIPCGPNCFCQTIWCKKKYTHIIRNARTLGFYRITVWNKYPCRCECRGFWRPPKSPTTQSPGLPTPTTNYYQEIPPWERQGQDYQQTDPRQNPEYQHGQPDGNYDPNQGGGNQYPDNPQYQQQPTQSPGNPPQGGQWPPARYPWWP